MEYTTSSLLHITGAAKKSFPETTHSADHPWTSFHIRQYVPLSRNGQRSPDYHYLLVNTGSPVKYSRMSCEGWIESETGSGGIVHLSSACEAPAIKWHEDPNIVEICIHKHFADNILKAENFTFIDQYNLEDIF